MARKRARSNHKRNSIEVEQLQIDDVKQTCVWKKDRRLRKKILKRCSKLQFQEALGRTITSAVEAEDVYCSLPESVFQPNCDQSRLAYLSDFVNRYLHAAEDPQSRSHLQDFYLDTSYLTLQVAPYLCRSEDTKSAGNKSKLKSEPLWSTYERLATNLLPGSLPLPAWAWAHLCSHRKQRPDKDPVGLGKQERQQLKALRVLQAGHVQRLSSAFPSTPVADQAEGQRPALGRQEISRLLSELPRLIHVRSDECSRLDVIVSQPSVVCFRYSCLAAEPTSSARVPGLAASQLFTVQSVGHFLVRIVQRSMLVALPAGVILQEDLSVMPAPAAVIREYSHLLASAVSLQPAATPTSWPEEDPHRQMLATRLARTTGMTPIFSWQCLAEHGFSLPAALEAFERVREADMLPAEAFVHPSEVPEDKIQI